MLGHTPATCFPSEMLDLVKTLFSYSFSTVIHVLVVPLCISYMSLNNGYFSTNLKGLKNSVTRHFSILERGFCMVLNMYSKKKKVAGVCPNICLFRFLQPENSIFPVEFLIYIWQAR
ncbi:hypothetical protein TSAR_011737 [Trichomalopsis sarcophagae]|uniref:Uncharacterized protein n=1 Tax=Trichomalopsis sarcophagae TaxID=543379 RepID=A0A232EIV7_9HYME|nr:hypothetical protein TSAR_011737 [Trichomalopsis sarcophagae]